MQLQRSSLIYWVSASYFLMVLSTFMGLRYLSDGFQPRSGEAIELSASHSIRLKGGLSYEDTSQNETIESIAKKDQAGLIPWSLASPYKGGFQRHATFLKIRLRNPEHSHVTKWILVNDYLPIKDMYLHDPVRSLTQVVGRGRPFFERPWPVVRETAVSLKLPPGEEGTFYVGYHSTSTKAITPRFLSASLFLRYVESQHAYLRGLITVYALLLLLHVCLFLVFRDKKFLIYFIYSFSMGMANLSLNGISYEYLWPDWVKWNEISSVWFLDLSQVWINILAFAMIEPKRSIRSAFVKIGKNVLQKRVPKGASWFLVMASFWVLMSLYGACIHRGDYGLGRGTGFCLLSLSFFQLFLCLRLGARVQCLFDSGIACLAVVFGLTSATTTIFALRGLGFLENHFITIHIMELASVIEMVLLGCWLIWRMRKRRLPLLFPGFMLGKNGQKMWKGFANRDKDKNSVGVEVRST